MIFKTDEAVIIKCCGITISGSVELASQNGRSLFLNFDGVIDGHVGAMPILLENDEKFRFIISGAEVELTKKVN